MPYSPNDIDLMARTMVGENGQGSPEEYTAIANVMRNRLLSGDPQYGGNSMSQIILARTKPGSKYFQFSPWNDPSTKNYPSKVDQQSPAYQRAYQAASDVMGGQSDDPTNGAVNYHASNMKKKPDWAQGREGQQIGSHTFYGPSQSDTVSDKDFARLAKPEKVQAPSQVAGEDTAPETEVSDNDFQRLQANRPKIPPPSQGGDPNFHNSGLFGEINPQVDKANAWMNAHPYQTLGGLALAPFVLGGAGEAAAGASAVAGPLLGLLRHPLVGPLIGTAVGTHPNIVSDPVSYLKNLVLGAGH